MIRNLEVFEKAPVPKAVAALAIPTVLSMLVSVLYNMVDTFFVARTGDPNQVAAVSLATPVFLFLMAAGNIYGIGGSAYLSRSLGEKKTERAKHISAFCFYAGIGTGIVLGALFIAGMPFILKWCGASPHTAGYARDYLSWIAWGAPAVVVSTAFTNLVRGEGSARAAMIGMMIGTVVNIILDPIMILTMKMGVAGAAIATVIGNLCSCAYYMFYILSGRHSILSLKLSDVRTDDGIAANVFAIGTPASLNNVLMSLSNILMNNFLAGYGDIPVASMGIAMKANMLPVFMQLGVSMGIQPLIGYNYGAKNYKRMKETMRFAMLTNVIVGAAITVVYFFFTRQIISFFIDNREVVDRGVYMLRALMISMPVLGIQFIFSFTFQATGKAIPSLILSISRQGFVFLPALIIGRAVAGLDGVTFAQPIADYVSIAIALIMFLSMNRGFKAAEAEAAAETETEAAR